jgi:hypothetical protein
MPDYRLAARRAAKRHGINPDLFERQIGAESNFNPHAGSPAGARGIAQFMPATAKSMGVNLNDNRSADDLDGAARLMANSLRKYGNWRDALTAYNAGPGRVGKPLLGETSAYIQRILGGFSAGHEAHGKATVKGAATIPNPSTVTTPGVDNSAQRAQLIQDFLGRRDQNPVTFAMGIRAAQDVAPTSTTTQSSTPTPVVTQGSAHTLQGTGAIKITGPNPGRIKPSVLALARKTSAIYGKPLTGSDGTGHSRLTVDGNVSQHSTGNATDIPATGKALIAMGQAALEAAGMPRAQARKQTGGLFNVHGHQIIFNTHQGGDHTNHLHISAR